VYRKDEEETFKKSSQMNR